MGVYAADLGAVDRDDPAAPRVYRDAGEFFRTTYPTRALRRLLSDVLGVLAGAGGDRVIQLRTPFGGGKTHSLLALLHLMRGRDRVDAQFLEGLPDPGPGHVAVLACLDLDPIAPREVEGLKIRTLWGELAYRLGGRSLYEEVRSHDEEWAAPGGDVLRRVLGDRPVLILMDEVLVYAQRAGGEEGHHPRRRQVLDFLQILTEVVKGSSNAALVYSLQQSAYEAGGEEALLIDLDHLVSRVDAKRVPVSDEEIMRVVQRRLFPSFGDDPSHSEVARAVAREYAIAFRRSREASGDDVDRRSAGVEAERFEQRILDAYPFHPALLDLMYHRWGSLPSYQRTRGALQFLASVVAALWRSGTPRSLITAGDVPLDDERVRGAFFSQVGEIERYSSVLAADITGSEARALEVDRRVAADSPALSQLAIGRRCATAIALYSFGARTEERGVPEGELTEALVAPDIDRNLIVTAVHDLREALLYLHYTGRRYRFEPKANLNLLLAEEAKKFDPNEVTDRVKQELSASLGAVRDQAVLWPPDSGAIPDEARFQVVYLGPSWSEVAITEVQMSVRTLVDERSPGRRTYKNALAFAVPAVDALDRARHGARTLMSIESLSSAVKARRHDLEKEQSDELTERQRGARAELSGALDRMYEQVLVPVADRGGSEVPFRFEVVDLRAQLSGGRALHERVLDGLRKHVFDALTPSRLVSLVGLGDDRDYVATEELIEWFFAYFDYPKLFDAQAIKAAIARGTTDTFGYVAAARIDGSHLVAKRPELVRYGVSIPVEEVDLGPGCFVVTAELALALRGEPLAEPSVETVGGQLAPTILEDDEVASEGEVSSKDYHLRVEVDAAQFFRIMPALQNLADRAAQFHTRLDVHAKADEAWDKSWLRNAVEEHLDEAGVEHQGESG